MCVRCACTHVCVHVFVCAFMCVNMGVPAPWITTYLSEGNLGCQPSAFTWIKTRSHCLCCTVGKLSRNLPGILLSPPFYHLTVEVLDCRCLGQYAAFNRVLSTQTQVLTFIRLGILFIEPSSPQPLMLLPNVHFWNPC